MFDLEEQLKTVSRRLRAERTNQVDDSLLEEAIMRGLQQGENEHRRRKQIRRRRGIIAIALSSMIIILAATVLTSPAITARLMDIPGIRFFVKLIEGDRTLEKAINQDFIQPVGITAERDGIILTVDAMMIDSQRIVLFITAKQESDSGKLTISHPQISSEQQGLQIAMVSFGSGNLPYFQPFSEPDVYRDMIDFTLNPQSIIPDEITFHSTWYNPVSGVETELALDIPIDHLKFSGLSEEIELQQTIDIQGQKVTIARMMISPLRTVLEVMYDPANTKQIFGFTKLYLEDEHGEKYAWTSSTGLSENHQFLYFEGGALQSFEQLTLVGEYVNVMDKKLDRMVIDTEQKTILEAPDDRIRFESISLQGQYMELTMTLNDLDEIEARTMYSMLGNQFVDGDGSTWQMARIPSGTTPNKKYASEPERQYVYFYLPAETYSQPLTFEIKHYPGYIHQPFRLRLK